MSTTDHRANARKMLDSIADEIAALPISETYPIAAGIVAQFANAHALLAVEHRLAEVVEQLQLANLITARAEKDEAGNRVVPLGSWQLEDAEHQHVVEAITRIVGNGVA